MCDTHCAFRRIGLSLISQNWGFVFQLKSVTDKNVCLALSIKLFDLDFLFYMLIPDMNYPVPSQTIDASDTAKLKWETGRLVIATFHELLLFRTVHCAMACPVFSSLREDRYFYEFNQDAILTVCDIFLGIGR
jgi:hypothetical protein